MACVGGWEGGRGVSEWKEEGKKEEREERGGAIEPSPPPRSGAIVVNQEKGKECVARSLVPLRGPLLRRWLLRGRERAGMPLREDTGPGAKGGEREGGEDERASDRATIDGGRRRRFLA